MQYASSCVRPVCQKGSSAIWPLNRDQRMVYKPIDNATVACSDDVVAFCLRPLNCTLELMELQGSVFAPGCFGKPSSACRLIR